MTSLGHLRITAVGGEFGIEAAGLASELCMVRAALLYADEVAFCSQRPELVAQDRFFEALGDHFDDLDRAPRQLGSWRAGMEELVAVTDGSLAAPEATHLEAMSDVFAIVDPAELLASSRRLTADLADLRALEATGLVSSIEVPGGWPLEEQAIHSLEAIDVVVAEAARGGTAPLLDAAAWEYVAMVDPGSAAGPAIDHASVAGRMVAEVEGYADAPLDVLVDVRADLRPYLAAFRAAVLRLTEELPPSSDPGFEVALRQSYIRDVEPQLVELEAAMRRSGAKAALARVAVGTAAVAPSALSLVAGLADWAAVMVGGLGASIGLEVAQRYAPPAAPAAEDRSMTWLWKAKRALPASS